VRLVVAGGYDRVSLGERIGGYIVKNGQMLP
jgi:hypothetical protein